MKIGILTDSTCDLPDSIIKEYNIEFIPLTVRIGDKQY
ncbi:MAG: DegV family protein, partial [Halanaerobiales bacterium]|nr:DegV family protein [Halanaerobiales bacterium]